MHRITKHAVATVLVFIVRVAITFALVVPPSIAGLLTYSQSFLQRRRLELEA